MKILRTVVLVLFVVVSVLYIIFKIQQQNADNTYPVITVEDEMLNVSITATEKELLQGVTAYDEKDGDLTDELIVESISRFTQKGISVVQYAVCDSDNHTASASRRITYTDYESPRFTLSGSLVFSVSQAINIRSILGAADSIDGNISKKVIITADEYSSSIAGVYNIFAKVANSKGDTIQLQLPVYVEERSLSAPKIELREYMTYLKTGDSFDMNENVVSCLDYDGNSLESSIVIDTDLDLTTQGIYEVHYRVRDFYGREGHSITTVIVEN